MSNGCVKHASSHTYTSVKPPTVNRKTHGMELKRLLFLEPFHLTLGSKSLQIVANPLRTGSSHHYGHQRPMCWSWCHSCISFSSEVVPFPSSETVVPRSQCASPLFQQPEPSTAQPSPAQHSRTQAGSSTFCHGPGFATAQPWDTGAKEGQNRMWHLLETHSSAGLPDSPQRHGPNQQLQPCKLDLYTYQICIYQQKR